jgi:hypothetical protein
MKRSTASTIRLALAALLLTGLSISSRSALILGNSIPDDSGGLKVQRFFSSSPFEADFISYWAIVFTPDQDYELTEVDFRAGRAPASSPGYSLSVFITTHGGFLNPFAGGTFVTGFTAPIGSSPEDYSFSPNIPIVLTGGTKYVFGVQTSGEGEYHWKSASDPITGAASVDQFYHEFSSNSDPFGTHHESLDPFNGRFAIRGVPVNSSPVPESGGTLLLLGFGLALLPACRSFAAEKQRVTQ